jgi:hypothetical protein
MVANNEVKPQITTAAKHPLETPGSKSSTQATKTIDMAKSSWMGPTRSQQQSNCM